MFRFGLILSLRSLASPFYWPISSETQSYQSFLTVGSEIAAPVHSSHSVSHRAEKPGGIWDNNNIFIYTWKPWFLTVSNISYLNGKIWRKTRRKNLALHLTVSPQDGTQYTAMCNTRINPYKPCLVCLFINA